MRSEPVPENVSQLHYFPWSPTPISLTPGSPYLRVSFGQATFDAEGTESAGRYFSRHISWPGGQSGVTIGRGYDMGQRTQLQVARELMIAGMGRSDAVRLAAAAGLRGRSAELFVRNRQGVAPIMSVEVQQRLFEEITTPEIIADVKRILEKSDTVSLYGPVHWHELPRSIQEFLFDLRYRGDYTPAVRREIHPLLAGRDYAGLSAVANNVRLWTESFGVPLQRARVRATILSQDL